MAELEKIPVPWSQRWRALRFRILPIFVFALSMSGVAYLWNRQLVVTQATGEVYAQRADIAVGIDGVLADSPYRNWKLFDRVEAGDLIARLDDRPVLAQIATVMEELAKAKGDLVAIEETTRLEQSDRVFEHVSEARRLAVEIESRRLAIADRKALLATDRIDRLRQRERLDLIDDLIQRRVMSKFEHLEFQQLHDVVVKRIKGHEAFLTEADLLLTTALQRIQHYSPAETSDAAKLLQPVRAELALQEARLRELELQRELLEIRAPISGHLMQIAAWPGQSVRRGTVIYTVASDEAAYIVSYVRHNHRLQPHVGTNVIVRPRINRTQVATCTVDRVGPQVELVPPHQLRDPKLIEWGLPVRIPVPNSLKLRPGELVDLKFSDDPLPPGQGADLVQSPG